MACGTPVITSNNSSLPEVVGDAAILIDPHNIQEMAEAMSLALHDSGLRRDMVAKGFAQAAKFFWAQTARETLAVYRSLGEGS